MLIKSIDLKNIIKDSYTMRLLNTRELVLVNYNNFASKTVKIDLYTGAVLAELDLSLSLGNGFGMHFNAIYDLHTFNEIFTFENGNEVCATTYEDYLVISGYEKSGKYDCINFKNGIKNGAYSFINPIQKKMSERSYVNETAVYDNYLIFIMNDAFVSIHDITKGGRKVGKLKFDHSTKIDTLCNGKLLIDKHTDNKITGYMFNGKTFDKINYDANVKKLAGGGVLPLLFTDKNTACYVKQVNENIRILDLLNNEFVEIEIPVNNNDYLNKNVSNGRIILHDGKTMYIYTLKTKQLSVVSDFIPKNIAFDGLSRIIDNLIVIYNNNSCCLEIYKY